MAVRLRVADIEIECDSPEEAVSMVAALRNGVGGSVAHRPRQADPAPRQPDNGEAAYESLFLAARPEAIQMLDLLANHESGIPAKELSAALGLEESNLGWVRRKFENLSRSRGVPPESLYSVVKMHRNGHARTVYTPTPTLRRLRGAAD